MFSRRKFILGSLSSAGLLMFPTTAFAQTRSARIIVSLADNLHQGIVPVPKALGNGQDPNSNLYWGAMYGLRTYLNRQPSWTVNTRSSENPAILQVINLSHDNHAAQITAEAWDGAHQKQALKAYFKELSSGSDELVIFVGHNPAMDIYVQPPLNLNGLAGKNKALGKKSAFIACQSQKYFEQKIKDIGVESYVMTAGNMAPEAYVIEAILRAWLEERDAKTARRYAAQAYSKYQKIPIRNSNWLFNV